MSTLLDRNPVLDLGSYKTLENEELAARIASVRAQLGPQLLILGHHYQQDEVIAHCDLRGDSYQLSQLAAARFSRLQQRCAKSIRYIVAHMHTTGDRK